MGKLRKNHVGSVGFSIALFLAMAVFFAVFRYHVADYAAWLLAMTNEITLAKQDVPASSQTIRIETPTVAQVTGAKPQPSRAVAVSRTDIYRNPVTTNLPHTATPSILFVDGIPDWRDPGLIPFPALRKFDGSEWNVEKTVVEAATDGRRLYLKCLLYDRDPRSAVTRNSRQGGSGMAWKDDSIEFFLMKDKNSRVYCQYVVSVGGSGHSYFVETTDVPVRGNSREPSANFDRPRFTVDEFAGGFRIDLAISLGNVGISRLRPGDTLLLQLVRNYRGQGDKDSVLLHLFPTHIYGDNRLGGTNHDRRAFQPARVVR